MANGRDEFGCISSDEFESSVRRTMSGGLTQRDALSNFALGLAGEAGEAADLLKKHLFHGHDLDKTRFVKELGDVAFYLTALAVTLGYSLDDVLKINVEKLKRRYPNGFSKQDSQNRSADDHG